ncbi:Nucleoid-associated protein bll8115 [Alphaproteobacteria bacterium]
MNFNFQQMMKQAQMQAKELQKKFSDMQNGLEHLDLTGESGGGKVKVTANAKGTVKKVEIDPSLFVAEEREVVEDLIVAALNNAKRKAEEATNERMRELGISPDLLKMSGLA